jgi:hypothetical protein
MTDSVFILSYQFVHSYVSSNGFGWIDFDGIQCHKLLLIFIKRM